MEPLHFRLSGVPLPQSLGERQSQEIVRKMTQARHRPLRNLNPSREVERVLPSMMSIQASLVVFRRNWVRKYWTKSAGQGHTSPDAAVCM